MEVENFLSFDLGENDGGKQIIINHKKASPTEYYVETIGDGIKTEENSEKNNTKLRFFKLTLRESGRYLVEEYVTPESICKVARLFTS